MKASAFALSLIVLLAAASICTEVQATEPETETKPIRQRIKDNLDQLAVLVNAASQGKSRLMIERTQSANPSGNVPRSLDWLDIPFVQACPVSKLFTTKLGDFGEGTVMGAVTLLEMNLKRSGDGVYLIFIPRGSVKGISARPTHALLVLVTVDSTGKVTYTQHLDAKRTDQTFSSAGELPLATVAFSGTKVEMRMRWDAETYTFVFEPNLIFL